MTKVKDLREDLESAGIVELSHYVSRQKAAL